MSRPNRRSLLVLAGLVALVGWLAPAAAMDSRIVVRLDEPFVVDGRLYPAGVLSVRQISAYSPVLTLNEIQVDGRSIGLLMARDRARAGLSLRDELTFQRGSGGHLVLVSIALRGERERTLVSIGESTPSIAAAPPPGRLGAAMD